MKFIHASQIYLKRHMNTLLFNEEKKPVNPEPQGSIFYIQKGDYYYENEVD